MGSVPSRTGALRTSWAEETFFFCFVFKIKKFLKQSIIKTQKKKKCLENSPEFDSRARNWFELHSKKKQKKKTRNLNELRLIRLKLTLKVLKMFIELTRIR